MGFYIEITTKKILCLICAFVIANSVFAYTYVNDYYKKDGTYVRGHYRSNPTSYGMNINPQNSNNYRQQYGNKDPYHNYFFPKPNYNPQQRRNNW